MKHLIPISALLFSGLTGLAVAAWQERTGKDLSAELRKDDGVMTVVKEVYGSVFWRQLRDIVVSAGSDNAPADGEAKDTSSSGEPYRTADGTPYKLPSIADLDLVEHSTRRIAVDDLKFTLTLMYQARGRTPLPHLQRAHPPRLIFETMVGTASILGAYLEPLGINLQECRTERYNLIVVVVEKAILFDRSRFQGLYNAHVGPDAPPGTAAFGLYNSTPAIENNSTVLVADVGAERSIEVLAHEYGHYFWDRFCLSNQLGKETEAFAWAFGKYYVRDR
ncbi:MAG: hypothetical protein VX223_12080 [Myxococcota bacterium]|nr:hypothetical protein [Myxococcota bacterium]